MDDFDLASNLIEKRIEKAIKESGQRKIRVIYSASDDDENGNPIDNLDEIAVKGKVILIGNRDEFFGGRKSRNYRSEILTNPTWLEVSVCANAMIGITKDEHHVFLEGLTKLGKEGKITLYEFLMGS